MEILLLCLSAQFIKMFLAQTMVIHSHQIQIQVLIKYCVVYYYKSCFTYSNHGNKHILILYTCIEVLYHRSNRLIFYQITCKDCSIKHMTPRANMYKLLPYWSVSNKMKDKKQLQNPIEKSQANLISLHIYMIAHSPGLVQALEWGSNQFYQHTTFPSLKEMIQ